MRQALGWTTLSLIWVAGCTGSGMPGEEIAAARAEPAVERDLTLGGVAAPALEVASPVELGRPEPPKRATTSRRRAAPPAPAPSKAPPRPDAAPSPEPVAVAAAEPAPAPVPAEPPPSPEPASDSRELLPGQTVAVIPASAGPSPAGPDDLGLPTGPARGMFKPGAGQCPHPPRGVGGRPVGIARFPLLLPRR